MTAKHESSSASARTLAAALARTAADQSRAADPTASAWVSANAGTGKTYVLVARVLRLLLAGAAPDHILCLTYTKAAAAEMSGRLFDRLALWATATPAALEQELAQLLGRPASVPELQRARTLFALTIETPGGLKVQTIHSFCERLLKRFPLESGVSPHFSVLDEESARALLREATDAVLAAAARGVDEAAGEALSRIVAYSQGEQFDALVSAMLAKRDQIEHMLRLEGSDNDPRAAIDRTLRRLLGVRPAVIREELSEALATMVPPEEALRLATILETGKETDIKAAAKLRQAAAANGESRIAALAQFFLTKEGLRRKNVVTAGVSGPRPDIEQRLTALADRFAALYSERHALEVVEATTALISVSDEILQRFAAAKADRGALDYDDLIIRTVRLLGQSADAQWVLYKLDNGLEHILVDEAQDTSPLQWQIIRSLAAEFYSGSSDTLRTIFAVGDEKQSIYGFQGAVPEKFAEVGGQMAAAARAAGAKHHAVPLDLSFRTVTPVLEAVDRVFADPDVTPGLAAERGTIRHIAHRAGHAGLVEIWPTAAPLQPAPASAWEPLEDRSAAASMLNLAERIARQIRRWLESGERLESEDRPITPGDILILVRKRRPFAPAMIKALKAQGLPVAGADRIRVTEQIAVEDLIALGDFLLLPEDDLALATVLKSPLFGLSDDELFAIGHGRRGSLWQALLAKAESEAPLAGHAETLKRWRSRADFLPPFEFYATLLDRDGVRQRLIERLGPESGDAIDQLLNLAMQFDAQFPPSLQGFLDWLRQGSPEIRRDMDQGRDEIRVMTVHGAKGLEAPIVFLPDTCTGPHASQRQSIMSLADPDLPPNSAEPIGWAVKTAGPVAAIIEARESAKRREREEFNRLLYVAMTRARDRLYVAGFEGKRAKPADCWYSLISRALEGVLEQAETEDGSVWRLASRQTVPPSPVRRAAGEAETATALPDWARRPAPREPARAIPLAPSQLAPLETEEGTGVAAPAEPVIDPPAVLTAGRRFLRGTLTHALLQHLPSLARQERPRAGARYLEIVAPELPQLVRESILAETLAVLEHPEFAPLFGEGSQAEVPITAEIVAPDARGFTVRVTGQIDRLLVTDDAVSIVDFKTNRPPPEEQANVPESYLLQLAAYRAVLQRIYPGRRVAAYLLWTDGARLMPLSDAALDAAERSLFMTKP